MNRYRFEHKFHDESEVIVTASNLESLPDVMQEFRRFLLAVGFQEANIKEYIEAE